MIKIRYIITRELFHLIKDSINDNWQKQFVGINPEGLKCSIWPPRVSNNSKINLHEYLLNLNKSVGILSKSK